MFSYIGCELPIYSRLVPAKVQSSYGGQGDPLLALQRL